MADYERQNNGVRPTVLRRRYVRHVLSCLSDRAWGHHGGRLAHLRFSDDYAALFHFNDTLLVTRDSQLVGYELTWLTMALFIPRLRACQRWFGEFGLRVEDLWRPPLMLSADEAIRVGIFIGQRCGRSCTKSCRTPIGFCASKVSTNGLGLARGGK